MSGKWLSFAIVIISLAIGGIITYRTQPPVCANTISCRETPAEQIENHVTGIFNGQPVTPPVIDLAVAEANTAVLGETDAAGEKHIFVDLSTQTLSAYQGETLIFEAKVSTGKWNKTPVGEFTIWSKFRATRMSGGEGNDYYDLPNVPYTMFFSGSGIPAASGYALHGAYWHNNFGHPMSHGCINLREVDAKKLFYWAAMHTPITIYGVAPI